MVLTVSGPSIDADTGLRARIVAEARELFLRRGFASVTTGEIAREAGIGKATLYKSFPSKEALLRAVVESIKADILAGVEGLIGDASLGFLDKFVRLVTFLGDWFSRLGAVFVQDLRRSAPGVWRELDEFRKEKILVNFGAIIEAGVAEGLFRPDIDRDLAVRMFLGLVQGFLNPDALRDARHSARDIFENLFKLFFEGILTDRARAGLAGRAPGTFLATKEVPR